MRGLLLRKKKIFFVGGIVALLVVTVAGLVANLKSQGASAYENTTVNLTIPGNSATGYFKINGQTAWCVTPALADPYAGTQNAVVYSLDELKNGKTTSGADISAIRQMFIAYYYASENRMTQNNEAMHWGLAHLYQGLGRNTGANAGQVWDWGQLDFPSNLESGSVTMIPATSWSQAIFTANYTVKTTYTQKLQIKKIWRDGLSATDHDISIRFKVKDLTTNSYITIDDNEIGELNNDNNWTITKTFERNNDENNHTYSVEEIVTGDGYHTSTDTASGNEYWYHDSLKDSDDNTIFYVMPSSDTQGCDDSDPYNVTCTMYNKSYNLTTVNLWTTKRWSDIGFTSYRPDSISYIIHAFIEVNNVWEEVQGLPHTGVSISKKNTYNLANTYTWTGTYVGGMATQYERDGVMYPVTYAIEEVSVPTAYGIVCDSNLTYQGTKYCKASMNDAGDYTVTWTNAIEKIFATARKHWNDGGNVAGKRPTQVAFEIYRNGTYYKTAYMTGDAHDDNWYTTVSLVKRDTEGNLYEYTYKEVDYYHRETKTYTSDDYIIDGTVLGFSIDENVDGMYNVAKTDIPVKKCFVDSNKNKRPESIDFELFIEGRSGAIDNLILTSSNEGDDGCWTGTFEDLPVYDDEGNEIVYRVEEDDSLLTNYILDEEFETCEVDAADNFAADSDHKQSCTFYNIEVVDIPVKKVWAEDKKEDRPGSIEVSLLCGKTVLDTVTLSEENNLDGDNTWEYTWKKRRIDECEQGFSVAENINVPGYATKITGNVEDGFVITNTKTLDEILTWGSLGAGSVGLIAAGFFVVKRKLFDR